MVASIGLILVEPGKGCVRLSFANGQRAGLLTAQEARMVAAELVKHADAVGDVSGAIPFEETPAPRVRVRQRSR